MATRTVGSAGADFTTLQAAIDAASAGDRIEIIGPPLTGDDHIANLDVNDLTIFTATGEFARLTLVPGTSVANVTLEGNGFDVTGNDNPTTITSSAVVLNTTGGTAPLTVLGGELDGMLGSAGDDVFFGRNGDDGLFPGTGNDALDFGVSTASDFENRGPNEYVFDGLGTGIDTVFNFDIDADHSLNGVMTNLPDGTRDPGDGAFDAGGDQIILYGQDRQIFDLAANGLIPGANIRFHIGQVEGSGGAAAWDNAFASHLAATGYSNPTGANTDWDIVIEIDYTGLGFPPGTNATILHDAIAANDTAALDGLLEAAGGPGTFDDTAANTGLQQLTTAQANAFIDYLGDSLAFYFRVDPNLVGHVDGTYAPNLPFQTFTTLQAAVNGATPPGFFSALPETGDWITLINGDYTNDGSVILNTENYVSVGVEALNLLIGGDALGVKLVLADDNIRTAAVNDAVQEINLFSFGDATVVGNDAANRIIGEYGHGDYTISGLGGDDIIDVESSLGSHTLDGGAGSDTITGGAQGDVIFGGSENDFLFGEGGNDRIVGGSGNDLILGGDGDDHLSGTEGSNTINGGAGHDTILGGLAGDDVLRGGSGQDILIGLGGNDAVDLGDSSLVGTQDPLYGVDANRGFTESVGWGLGSGFDTVFNFDIDTDGTLNQFYGFVADGVRGPADGLIDGISDNWLMSGIDRAVFDLGLAGGFITIHVGQAGQSGGTDAWDVPFAQHLAGAGYANPTGPGEAWDLVVEFNWEAFLGLPPGNNNAIVFHDVIALADQAAWNVLLDGAGAPFDETAADTGLVALSMPQTATAIGQFGDSLSFVFTVDPTSVFPEGAIGALAVPVFTSLAAAQLGGNGFGIPAEVRDGDTVTFSANGGDYSGLGAQLVTKEGLAFSADFGATGVNLLLADDNADTAAVNDAIRTVSTAGQEAFVVTGNAADNILNGQFGLGDDTFNGLAGNDTLIGGAGNDTLNGGAGDLDTAVYALSSDNYLVSFNSQAGTYTVIARAGNEGVDTLTGIEQLAFSAGAEVGAINSFVDAGTSTDFNGDGDDDFLFQFADGNKLISDIGTGNTYLGIPDRAAAGIGDFDGDGDADILLQFANGDKLVANVGAGNTWLGASDRTAEAVGDFDGDGDDDILFEFANGDKLIANVGSGNTWLGANDRTAEAVGDFDGDGDDDILFEFANGDKLIANIGSANTWLGASDRTAKAVGDFDGDGDDDILFEFADGNKLIFNAGQGNTWLGFNDRSVAAVGDFDGDGDDDILFEFANGDKIIANVGGGGTWLGASDRTARAVGDFDGDGDDDILMEFADGNQLILNVGVGNQWLGLSDRDAIGSDLTGLGLAIEVA